MAAPTIASTPALRSPAPLQLALALIGFSAVLAQVVLMRELMVVFHGNEMSAGFMLASWLLWTAFGSAVLGRLAIDKYQSRRVLGCLQLLIAITLPATIFSVRSSRLAFHALPGELLGPGVMLATALLTLSVFCSLSGWLFAAGARLYRGELACTSAAATGNVYLLETIGAAVGGLLASVLLAAHTGAFAIALLVACANAISAIVLSTRSKLRRWTGAAMACALALSMGPLANQRLETASLARLWSGMRVLDSRNSRFSNLVVVQNENGRTLYENGLPVFTVPDPAAAEEAVHYALLQHPGPQRVLLVGAGLNGSVREALKHPSVEHVDYVELDPEVFRIAADYFAPEWKVLIADKRVRVFEGDGRRFVNTARDRWDVIIVNLPEPQTAQLNRFYTREFFQQAKSRLSPGGLLSLQLPSSENYISPQRAEFLRCIHRTLRDVFPEVGFIPGETVHFFAGEANTSPEAKTLIRRLQERRLQTSYVREYFLPFRMMPDRMAQFQEVLQSDRPAPINRDFSPVAYYFGVALWSTQFNHSYRDFFLRLAQVGLSSIVLVLAIAAFVTVAIVLMLGRGQYARAAAGLCVSTVGFTLIGLEVMLLLGFQSIYGYVYYELALLVAMFMIGMAGGSWWALRRVLGERTLACSQVAAVFAPALVYGALQGLSRIRLQGQGLQRDYLGEAAFVVLAAGAGMLGGMQFPAASRIFLGSQHGGAGENGAAGVLYALDLAGACAGAVAISAYVVPMFGFAGAAAVMAVVAAGPAVLALILVRRAAVSLR